MTPATLTVLVADGLRPDTLAAALNRGELPAMAALRTEGGLHVVTTVFPSVTGVAYVPFLTGRFPGPVGIPGLRWYDRARRIGVLLGHARSYTGPEMPRIDADLDRGVPTLFERLPREALGCLSVIGRGLRSGERVASGPGWTLRATSAHLRGDVDAWLAIDREAGAAFARAVRRRRPRFAFAAFTGIDKASHADGHDAPRVLAALRTVDDTVATLRRDAERDGRWPSSQVWVVSDHGHAPVHHHDELTAVLRSAGYRIRAHPFAFLPGAEVAVMVSGNAMAHVYVELAQRRRPFGAVVAERWRDLLDLLSERDSVDLVAVPEGPDMVRVRSRLRGDALISRTGEGFSYRHTGGDPLRLPEFERWTADAVHEASFEGEYPDAAVQLLSLAASERCGDVVLSAAPGWDFRARYEPIPHRSTHGGLHRDQMRVPLLVGRQVAGRPRRTVDVMPSALQVLGLPRGVDLDGRSFVQDGRGR